MGATHETAGLAGAERSLRPDGLQAALDDGVRNSWSVQVSNQRFDPVWIFRAGHDTGRENSDLLHFIRQRPDII